MTILRRLYEGTVQPEEIDELGHMNVRFYAQKARTASRALAASVGLDAAACADRGVVLRVTDAYTRHYREQLEGSRIAVQTGILAVDAEGLSLYHELINADSGELAASFVYRIQLLDRETREARFLPESLSASLAETVELPEQGRPRSINLQRRSDTLTLAEARRRGLSQREGRRIVDAQCDAQGFLLTDSMLELVWGGKALADRADEAPLANDGGGVTFGFATMESRLVMLRPPRVGARVQSFGAEVEIGRKAAVRNQWVFDLERGDPVILSSLVHLSFDIKRRRAIELPPRVRASLEQDLHPDLV